MLPPIGPPLYKYASNVFPEDCGAIFASTDFVIEEPCLRIHHQEVINTNPLAVLPTTPPPEYGINLRNKALGHKITVLVLCYGNYYNMHVRCLDSIIRTVPSSQLDLRIAANCVSTESYNYFKTLPSTKIYKYEENACKYPIMRDMLYDDSCPIDTNYFVWFDDSCYVQHSQWLNALAADILMQPKEVAMYGIKLYYAFEPTEQNPQTWFKTQPWYRGLNLRNVRGNPAPNGDCVHFCADWFFAMQTEAAKRCGIPDKNLIHKGGAIVIGEQLYQNGYLLKSFNIGKALVHKPNSRQLPIRYTGSNKQPWQTGHDIQNQTNTVHARDN